MDLNLRDVSGLLCIHKTKVLSIRMNDVLKFRNKNV